MPAALVPMARIERATSPLPRECSATELHGRVVDSHATPVGARPCPAFAAAAGPVFAGDHHLAGSAPRPLARTGAGEGNRTLVVSLEGFCSAIELHPRFRSQESGVRRQRSGNRSVGVSGAGALAPLKTLRSGSDSTPPGATCAACETSTRLLPVFCLLIPDWWRGKDSNLRRQSRQIYSLLPLTAREPLRETRNSSSR